MPRNNFTSQCRNWRRSDKFQHLQDGTVNEIVGTAVLDKQLNDGIEEMMPNNVTIEKGISDPDNHTNQSNDSQLNESLLVLNKRHTRAHHVVSQHKVLHSVLVITHTKLQQVQDMLLSFHPFIQWQAQRLHETTHTLFIPHSQHLVLHLILFHALWINQSLQYSGILSFESRVLLHDDSLHQQLQKRAFHFLGQHKRPQQRRVV